MLIYKYSYTIIIIPKIFHFLVGKIDVLKAVLDCQSYLSVMTWDKIEQVNVLSIIIVLELILLLVKQC